MKRVLVLAHRGVGIGILIAVSSGVVTVVAHGQGMVPGIGPTAPSIGPTTAPYLGPTAPSIGPTTAPSFGPTAPSFGPFSGPSYSAPHMNTYPSNVGRMPQRSNYDRAVQSMRNSHQSQFRTTAPGYDAMARSQRSYGGSQGPVYRSLPTRSSRGWFGGRRWRMLRRR